jgi:hypothetical protein
MNSEVALVVARLLVELVQVVLDLGYILSTQS